MFLRRKCWKLLDAPDEMGIWRCLWCWKGDLGRFLGRCWLTRFPRWVLKSCFTAIILRWNEVRGTLQKFQEPCESAPWHLEQICPQIPAGPLWWYDSQNYATWGPETLPIHVGDAATLECEGFDLIQLRTLFMQVPVAVWPLRQAFPWRVVIRKNSLKGILSLKCCLTIFNSH